jgi:hypothetical protein
LIDHLYVDKTLQSRLYKRQSSIKEYFQSFSCLSCLCKETKADRYYAKARRRLDKEVDLVEILRSIRLINLVISKQFSEGVALEMKQAIEKISVKNTPLGSSVR